MTDAAPFWCTPCRHGPQCWRPACSHVHDGAAVRLDNVKQLAAYWSKVVDAMLAASDTALSDVDSHKQMISEPPPCPVAERRQAEEATQSKNNQEVVDAKRAANDTARSEVDSHKQMISEPPPCPYSERLASDGGLDDLKQQVQGNQTAEAYRQKVVDAKRAANETLNCLVQEKLCGFDKNQPAGQVEFVDKQMHDKFYGLDKNQLAGHVENAVQELYGLDKNQFAGKVEFEDKQEKPKEVLDAKRAASDTACSEVDSHKQMISEPPPCPSSERLLVDGALGVKQQVQGKLTELSKQKVEDAKCATNDTAGCEVDSHMQMISEPPLCPSSVRAEMCDECQLRERQVGRSICRSCYDDLFGEMEAG